MRKPLFLIVLLLAFFANDLMAQPATVGTPVSIGRNNCGGGGGKDSIYFHDFVNPTLTRSAIPPAYKPLLKIGPGSTTNRFTINLASISYNPKDQKLYYLWTTYPTASSAITYVWRWKPDTTFANSGGAPTSKFLDTLRSFPYDIGGVAFDNSGTGWTLEFPPGPCSRAFLRPIDFATGVYNAADTLDFIPGFGLGVPNVGDTIFVPGSGDITILPSGQMYYNFDNKLFTPDYSSYGGATHHIKSTLVDSTNLPAGASALIGLAYANGALVAAYQPSFSGTCIYRTVDPVSGDVLPVTYAPPAGSGVYSVDMTQINSGIGAAKKLVSITPTGTPKQYDVIYDVYVKNYGSMQVTNIQVNDNLAAVNGPLNVSNVSAVFTANPAGLLLNPAFNGVGTTSLLMPGQTLVKFPDANSYFTIRIACRMSNIDPGTVYYNSAIATATGWNAVALRDSSTNGSNPDLNQNDRPDDLGEGQPTPFIVVLTPTVAPCNVLGQVIYNQTFGNGVPGLFNSLPLLPTAGTTYAGTGSSPVGINRFAITDSSQRGDASNWVKMRDHTGDAGGRMMVVNADAPANYFYRDTILSLCPGQQYSFSFYAAFLGNASYGVVCTGLGGFKYPRVKCRIRDLTSGLVITEGSTPFISSNTWTLQGIKWLMPGGYTNIIFELINDAPGGCGNDIAIDDIQFGICSTAPTVALNTAPSGCLGSSTTFASALSDSTAIGPSIAYQWQVSPDNVTWVNIGGATANNFTIASLTALDVNKYYRVIVAATGNMGSPTCQYFSPGFFLTAKTSSLPALTATRNKNNICGGIPVNLGITGGTLGTNAKWKWYTASCGGTLIDSGATITVTPLVTTTYYVRAVGDCNVTSCVSVTVNINCDIDKDDDGIPDYVESNMPAALLDVNVNGIMDAFDPSIPLYKDNNNDFINDDFQADGDSDGDGTPNYLDSSFPGRVDINGDGVDDRFDADRDGIINMRDLDSDNDGVPDVVEAYGVDTNGDAKIDNYTDTDGDGLSQNVDGNNTGARISGLGLGIPDFDGDGIPNFLDLDSDNDGIPDLVEAGGPDTNNNGIVDGAFTDANNDGLHDSYINVGALLRTGADIAGLGRAGSYPNRNLDTDAKPNPYDMDSDGDGIVDVIESGLPDANLDGVVDGVINSKGWSATVAAMPALNLRNTDGRGNPDYLDIDSDDDGIPDNIEGLPTASYLFPANADADGDGLDNSYDTKPGFGGSGIFVVDTDGDSTPDYRDLDTDADGQADIKEGNDFNLNGIADDNVTLTLLDADGDGLDNRFDSSNTSTKGTSYRLGNGGIIIGDPSPGTRSPVQKKTPLQTDRDWRYVGSTLPVQILQFTGSLQGDHGILNWQIITPVAISVFEVERSTDNSTFTKVGTVPGTSTINIQQAFAFDDNVSTLTSEVLFYRIRIVSADGQVKYSNVVLIRRNITKTSVKILPNPASDHFMLIFYAEKETQIKLKLMNNTGQTVLTQELKAVAGQNSLQVNNLERLSNGIYVAQFYVNDEVVTAKLILQKK